MLETVETSIVNKVVDQALETLQNMGFNPDDLDLGKRLARSSRTGRHLLFRI